MAMAHANESREPGNYDEKWAEEVRNGTRELVCSYARALEGVLMLKRPYQWVGLGGLSGHKNYLIFKPLLRDALLHRVRLNLDHADLLALRAYQAQRPRPKETRLGVRQGADPDIVATAEVKRRAFLESREKMASFLNEARDDIKSLSEIASTYKPLSGKIFKTAVSLVRRIAPIAVAGWVVTQFDKLRTWPTWQAILFALLILVAYHFVAWISLPFFNAAFREYVYLDGYMGKSTDGLDPLFPPVKRVEEHFYKLFDARPPIVVSWDEVVPILHYIALVILIVMLAVGLPLADKARVGAYLFAMLLIPLYLRRITVCCKWIAKKHQGRTFGEVALAFLTAIDWGAMSEAKEESTESPSNENDTKPA
jgi:hypothetical protein